MMELFAPQTLLVFLPALFRIGGMLFAGPIWNQVRIPLIVRTGATLFIAVAMWPVLSQLPAPEVTGLLDLFLLVGRELIIGIVMGLAATLFFVAVEYAGQMIGITIGLAIVNVMDPVFNTQISIISKLYGLFALAVFFAIDAHHILIGAVMESFQIVPVGQVVLGPDLITYLVNLGFGVFVTGVKIAAPIVSVMLVAEIAMGLVVRTVPQMNIFIVGFPLKIGMGFFLIAITLPYVIRLLEDLFGQIDRSLAQLLRGM